MDNQLLSHWQLRDEPRSKMRRKLVGPMITAKDARGQYPLRYTTLEQAKRWRGRNLKSDLNSNDCLFLNVFDFLFMHDLAWSNHSWTRKGRPTILKNLTCFQWHWSGAFSETKSTFDTSVLYALILLLPLLSEDIPISVNWEAFDGPSKSKKVCDLLLRWKRQILK